MLELIQTHIQKNLDNATLQTEDWFLVDYLSD